MRSSMAEELQSISVTSLRLLPLEIPALPARRGEGAVRTPTLAKHSSSHHNFHPVRAGKATTTAQPCNSTLERLTAPPELLLGTKKKNHFITHFHPAQGPAARKIKSLAGDRDRAGAEERVWGFFEHSRDWGWGCCFSFFHQPPQCRGAAGGNLQCHLHSGSPAPV